MKNLIDQVRIKAGRLVRVFNTDRAKAFGSNATYVAVWVEDANGKNERCLLFTESQIKVAQERANKNKEDLTKKNFFTDLID